MSQDDPASVESPRVTCRRVDDGDVALAVLRVDTEPVRWPEAMTPTEIDIARSLIQGHSTREIAARRGVSYRTVANQLQALYRRLGVGDRCELIVEIYRRAAAAAEPR